MVKKREEGTRRKRKACGTANQLTTMRITALVLGLLSSAVPVWAESPDIWLNIAESLRPVLREGRIKVQYMYRF
jgi:hypothetical protein